MSKNTKMILVSRTHFPDGKGGFYQCRKGKLLSQIGHAVGGAILNIAYHSKKDLLDDEIFQQWCNDGSAKISVGVKSEEELLELHKQAKAAKLNCYLVKDEGITEFHSVATFTSLAIGPDFSEKIDPITGHLSLL